MRTFDRREALGLAALLGTSLFSLSGCESGEPAADASSGEDAASDGQTDDSLYVPAEDDPYATGVHHATIEVEGYGTIEVALNANVAPITVSNFCNLAEEGFYDGLTFHRIIEGFMIQGGDPLGNGTGGSEKNIKGEFSSNGVENNIPHVRGTISMARSQDPDSASSQFFIMQETAEHLDGEYAAFGNVTSGIEVVDAICEAVPVEDSNGTVAAENQPVITKISIVD
ncbi:peptidyl-prolyl cis-trans isomerase [Olsenella sp. An285]|uniref:peptidylprolyl isomerase n=1 Tax=Olsenella sp. An285 TaxID=1965621 RepID=UPI000B3738BA|nr:peptidylprolyl isomerase [Olsenella sp. An285]OUO48126.1 peptidyl-prolyl cis-trans isomerase [Olsenella sp. An285]